MTIDSAQAIALEQDGCFIRNDSFVVFTVPASGAVPVCQFKNVAGDIESYFYSASPAECDTLRADPNWVWMTEDAFFVLPVQWNGHCAPGTSAVIRHYNDGSGGKPNHLYFSSWYKVKIIFGSEEGPVWCAPSLRK